MFMTAKGEAESPQTKKGERGTRRAQVLVATAIRWHSASYRGDREGGPSSPGKSHLVHRKLVHKHVILHAEAEFGRFGDGATPRRPASGKQADATVYRSYRVESTASSADGDGWMRWVPLPP